MRRIIITGGNGRFAKVLKKKLYGKKIYYLSKKQFNILNYKSLEKKIKILKPKTIIHLAALSRPMSIHEKDISNSINLNIIGTANLASLCHTYKIKLIYFSTNYVYPGKKGNYKEEDSLLPNNNYAWSKLGGECSVHMLKNFLILRICMTEKPFIHKKAFSNIISSFAFHDFVAEIVPNILSKKGVINIGGKRQSIYQFAKKQNNSVKKNIYKKDFLNIQKDSSININKLKKIINVKY